MEEVIHKETNAEVFAESTFNSLLSRYFSCACKEDRSGNLVCTVSVRNIRRPLRPRVETIRIHKDLLGNYSYVYACIEKCVRGLIYKIGN